MTFTRSAHKFQAGGHVWVRPARWLLSHGGKIENLHRFSQDEPFEVLESVTINGWPHYLLLAPDGARWQVSQLEASGVPLGLTRDGVSIQAPKRLAAA
jgi:hypothetical protein